MFLRYNPNIIFLLSVLATCVLFSTVSSYRQKTVSQRISTEEKFSIFNSLVQNTSLIRRAILYWNVTVFLPSNEAFQKFDGVFSTDLVYYHVANELKSLRMIFETNHLHSFSDGNFPLWIAKINGDLYVNNAKIMMGESDYFSRAVGGYYNHNQVIHVIDEVLDPPSVYSYNSTVLDIISNYSRSKFLPTTKYLERIYHLNATKLFQEKGGHTYFVPIDPGFNQYRLRMTDKYIIQGHIIPNQVLFTRPTIRNHYFETKSNGDYIYIVISLIGVKDKLFVKSLTLLGDSNHQKGELLSEIIQPNIPARNGVVHFIEKPLGIFDMQLKPFPYLPILNKLEGDPNLNTMFEMGARTKFNEHLRNTHSLLTLFVPRNKAWKGVLENLSDESEDQIKLLGKHLVISDVRHTMEMLWYRSFDRVITLNTVGGPVDMKVTRNEKGQYEILYGKERIKVYRPDYLCSNGIIHIIDHPFIDTKNESIGALKMSFWRSIEDFIF